MDVVSSSLPTRIEGTFDLPKVFELVQATGKETVQQFIHFELVKLSNLVSVGGNITTAQAQFIASELIELFPNETIADFKLCFQRGARGDYGDIFRMDGIVIRKWMQTYLEEKYQVLEDQMMKEKDSYRQTIIPEDPDETAKKYLAIMEEQLRPAGQKTTLSRNLQYLNDLKGLSEAEIAREGKEKPAHREYKGPSEEYVLISQRIKDIARKMYSGSREAKPYEDFKVFNIEGYDIFCESKEKAQEIYIQAISNETL